MAKGTPLKERKAGENKFRDIDKTGNPKRKPLSPSAFYGYRAHAGPQHIPASEIGNNMADALFDQEMTRDLLGDNPRGAASSKRVAGKLKNVMASKATGDASDPRAEGHPDIPYDYDEPNSLYDGFVGPIDPKMEGKNPPIDADHGKGHLPLDSRKVGDMRAPTVAKKLQSAKSGHPDFPGVPGHEHVAVPGYTGPLNQLEGYGDDDPGEYGHDAASLDELNKRRPPQNPPDQGKSKKAPGEKKRPPIPPYKPRGSTSSKKIPARGKPKLPLTGLARYGNQVR